MDKGYVTCSDFVYLSVLFCSYSFTSLIFYKILLCNVIKVSTPDEDK